MEKYTTDKIRIIYFYLPAIRERFYNKDNLSEIEKLLLVFNEQTSTGLKKLMKGNKIMEEYVNESEKTSKKEEIIGLYDKELYDEMMEYHKIRRAKEDGLEKGIKEGEKNSKIDIAKKMLENKIEVKIISNCTGLSVDEINCL